MQAVLHINISENPDFIYEKPILAYIQQHFSQVIRFDIDNHSDASLIGYAIRLLEEANQVLLVIEAKEGKTQVLLPFFEKLLIHQQKCLVIYNGTHVLTDRYIHLLENKRINRNLPFEEAQTSIQAFFEKGHF